MFIDCFKRLIKKKKKNMLTINKNNDYNNFFDNIAKSTFLYSSKLFKLTFFLQIY